MASIIVRSTKAGVGRFEIVARTNGVLYAQIHQFGGIIKPKSAGALAIPMSPEAKKKRPKAFGERLFIHKTDTGKVFLVENVGKGKRAKMVFHYILLKSVKIPARPFLVVQTEDIELLRENFTEAMTKLN